MFTTAVRAAQAADPGVGGMKEKPMATQPDPDSPVDVPMDDPIPTPTDPIPPTPSDPVVGAGGSPLTEGP